MINNNGSTDIFALHDVQKQFGKLVALRGITVSASEPSIIGLIGKNGSGKTTMLRLMTGLYLPTSGQCSTLGAPTAALDATQLTRLGVVYQRGQLVGWMSVAQMVRYVASYYESWDRALEQRLMRDLELNPDVVVSTLSPGNAQRLSLLLAVCHRPALLLLDEPFSDMDPSGREVVLALLLDLLRESETTIVISSHLLFDIERVVDRIVCLHAGRCVADSTLDDLKEKYGNIEGRPLNLARIFPILTGESAGSGAYVTEPVAIS